MTTGAGLGEQAAAADEAGGVDDRSLATDRTGVARWDVGIGGLRGSPASR